MTRSTPIFNHEWVDAVPSADKLSQATMASLKIRHGEDSLIAFVDHQSRSYAEAIIVPLFPLAEWFVSNWWFLWYEEEDLQHEQRPGFDSRHDLAHAGDGFVYPSITLLPLGDQMRIRTQQRQLRFTPIEFLAQGEYLVDRAELEDQLRQFIEVVIARVVDWGLSGTLLEEEWAAINALDESEREFCHAAALLGLDPFEAPDDASNSIVALWNRSDPMLREDLFASADAEALPEVKHWVDESLKRIEKAKSGPKWAQLRETLVVPPSTPWPWTRGYELARQARVALGLSSGPVDFEQSGGWSIHAIEASESDVPTQRIEGLVAANTPSCLIQSRRESGRRFLLARVIGEYLGRKNGSPSLLTSLASARQRESRAFAAEFLAPSDELKRRIGNENAIVSENTVDELAEDFRVSSYVIRHQIANHRLGRSHRGFLFSESDSSVRLR